MGATSRVRKSSPSVTIPKETRDLRNTKFKSDEKGPHSTTSIGFDDESNVDIHIKEGPVEKPKSNLNTTDTIPVSYHSKNSLKCLRN